MNKAATEENIKQLSERLNQIDNLTVEVKKVKSTYLATITINDKVEESTFGLTEGQLKIWKNKHLHNLRNTYNNWQKHWKEKNTQKHIIFPREIAVRERQISNKYKEIIQKAYSSAELYYKGSWKDGKSDEQKNTKKLEIVKNYVLAKKVKELLYFELS